MSGYSLRGIAEDKSDRQISVVPKAVRDAQNEWEDREHKNPKGEEKRVHDFKWTLAHEISHSISFQLGFGYRLKDYYSDQIPVPDYIKGDLEQWLKLEKKIRKSIKYPSAGSDGKIESLRLEGYPSEYSSTGRSGGMMHHEVLRDTISYIITDSHYADGDALFMERVRLAKDILGKIRLNQSKIDAFFESDFSKKRRNRYPVW